MALSELQISLIGLGGVGIVAVWAYNKWQERRHSKVAERVFRGDQPDVLLDAELVPVAKSPTANKEQIRVEPVLQPGQDRSVDSAPNSAAPDLPVQLSQDPPVDMLDPVIESVVCIEFPDMVPASRLRDAQQTLAGRLSKPVRWVGIDAGNQWCEVDGRNVSYRHLRAGLLLANREGALSETELHGYFNGMKELADRYAATVEFANVANVTDTLARASVLDEACASVDIQIAVHVVHREALKIPGAQVAEVARAAGLDLRDDGRFYSGDGSGATQFTMTNLGSIPFAAAEMHALSTHGITFWLDVPRVADAAAAFDRMMAAARQIATHLDGVLVDDHRSPLSDGMLLDIRAKIVEVQQQMTVQGFAPGGTRALRLFA
jgi:hypothetical protein